MLQLNGIAAFETDDRGKLINWEKKRQLFNIVKALQRFGKITFTYDYSGTAGGYLFNAEIWPDDVIRARVEDLPKDLPESRLLLTDFPQFNELIDDGIGDVVRSFPLIISRSFPFHFSTKSDFHLPFKRIKMSMNKKKRLFHKLEITLQASSRRKGIY